MTPAAARSILFVQVVFVVCASVAAAMVSRFLLVSDVAAKCTSWSAVPVEVDDFAARAAAFSVSSAAFFAAS